jgi:YD repeat-containing protein
VRAGGQTVTLVANAYDQYGMQLTCGFWSYLTNRTKLRQHDTANYGPGFYHRGNVTTSMNLSGTVCTNYDIAGAAVTAADTVGHTASSTLTSATNYAVPSTVTVNSLSEQLQWTAFLAPTPLTGPNGDSIVSVVETEYRPCACSPLGKVKKVSQPYAQGGTKYWTEYTWDALGRTLSVIHPGNTGTTTYVYDGIKIV